MERHNTGGDADLRPVSKWEEMSHCFHTDGTAAHLFFYEEQLLSFQQKPQRGHPSLFVLVWVEVNDVLQDIKAFNHAASNVCNDWQVHEQEQESDRENSNGKMDES